MKVYLPLKEKEKTAGIETSFDKKLETRASSKNCE